VGKCAPEYRVSTTELYLLNAVLATRLFLLFRDKAISFRYAVALWVLQTLLLLPLTPAWAVVLLAVVLAAVNGLWLWAEARFPQRLYVIRLTVLAILIAILGVFLAPAVGLTLDAMHPDLAAAAARHFAFARPIVDLDWRTFHIYVLGILLCVSEANLLVRVVIENFNLKPQDSVPVGAEASATASAEYKRGRVIGLLERLLLFYLVLGGHYGALGFVIAAKTMARFKNLEDRSFAEYFLVGTLLSLMAAGTVALFTRWLLHATAA